MIPRFFLPSTRNQYGLMLGGMGMVKSVSSIELQSKQGPSLFVALGANERCFELLLPSAAACVPRQIDRSRLTRWL